MELSVPFFNSNPIPRSEAELAMSHTPDLRASVDLGIIVELLQHFQLRGGSRVVMQPLVRSPFTCPPSLALEEDYLSAACPPPQIASAPRARPGCEP